MPDSLSQTESSDTPVKMFRSSHVTQDINADASTRRRCPKAVSAYKLNHPHVSVIIVI